MYWYTAWLVFQFVEGKQNASRDSEVLVKLGLFYKEKDLLLQSKFFPLRVSQAM